MKKHVLGLLFLFVHNVYAMELDPLAMTLKYDEKCKLVAKYLHKYPVGKNKVEASRIKQFLNDKTPSRAALSRCINRYKNMLQNMEAEEILPNIYEKYFYTFDNEKSPTYQNIPKDIKQKIFTQVLWDYAQQYYAIYNTCKFVCMEKGLIPAHCPNWPSEYYMPYFLAEIQERGDQYFFFYKKVLPRASIPLDDNCFFSRLAPPEFCEHSDDRVQYSDFYNYHTYYKCNKLKTKLFCYTNNLHGMSLESEEGVVRNLVFFLDIKELRVLAFKRAFNKSIEDLACINTKEGINAFIQLLTLYKQFPTAVASMYEDELRESVRRMLDDLPFMYERETNRKSIKKSARSGL